MSLLPLSEILPMRQNYLCPLYLRCVLPGVGRGRVVRRQGVEAGVAGARRGLGAVLGVGGLHLGVVVGVEEGGRQVPGSHRRH